MTIFVIGDAGYDHYIVGNVRGLSAEATIPILDRTGAVTLPGMAGNVTANLVKLTEDSPYVKVKYLERVQQNYPIKNRIMTTSGEQVARFDVEDWCRPYDKADLVGLLEADAIIVADYGKGSVSEEVIQILRQVTIPVFVDMKGDPSPWIGSDVTMFPNLEEYKRYEEKYNWFPAVVLKRGPQGLAFLEFGSVVLSRPSVAKFVRSVNGAGDTVIAAFALASMANFTLPECLAFANAAAANVVEQPFGERWTTSPRAIERMNDERDSDSPQHTRSSVVSRFGLYGGLGLAPVERSPRQLAGPTTSGAVSSEQPSIAQLELFFTDGEDAWNSA